MHLIGQTLKESEKIHAQEMNESVMIEVTCKHANCVMSMNYNLSDDPTG